LNCAEAVIELLTDRDKWCSARDAAIKRVETYYDDRDMIVRYRGIYDRYLADASQAGTNPLRKTG